MPKKFSLKIKLICSALVVTFLISDLSWAAPDLSFSPRLNPTQALLSNPSLLSIPSDACSLQEFYKGDNNKLIIHIQDAHCNLSGQKNLAATLDSLMKNYNLSLVLSEGGSSDCSLTTLKKVASQKIWETIATKYLHDGRINGEEYLNLTSNKPMKIIGIEEPSSYIQSVKNYGSLANLRSKALSHLNQVGQIIEKLKNRMYPDSLKQYEKLLKQNKFEDKINLLSNLASQKNVPLKNYPTFQELIKLNKLQSSIDFNLTNLEERSLIDKLSSKEALDSLKENSLKDQKLNQLTQLQKLLSLAQDKHINLKDYPNLLSYTDYLKQFSNLDLSLVLQEIERLEDEVYVSYLSSKDQRMLKAIDRYYTLLQTAYSIKMSTQDTSLLKANQEDFNSLRCLSYLNRKLAELGYYEDLLREEPSLRKASLALNQFYDSVSQRDYIFMDNIQKAMTDQNIAVLVTGGYHTDHLKELLKQNHYSYIILTPKVTQETNQKLYEERLLEPFNLKTKTIQTTQGETHQESSGVRPPLVAWGLNPVGPSLINGMVQAARLAESDGGMEVRFGVGSEVASSTSPTMVNMDVLHSNVGGGNEHHNDNVASEMEERSLARLGVLVSRSNMDILPIIERARLKLFGDAINSLNMGDGSLLGSTEDAVFISRLYEFRDKPEFFDVDLTSARRKSIILEKFPSVTWLGKEAILKQLEEINYVTLPEVLTAIVKRNRKLNGVAENGIDQFIQRRLGFIGEYQTLNSGKAKDLFLTLVSEVDPEHYDLFSTCSDFFEGINAVSNAISREGAGQKKVNADYNRKHLDEIMKFMVDRGIAEIRVEQKSNRYLPSEATQLDSKEKEVIKQKLEHEFGATDRVLKTMLDDSAVFNAFIVNCIFGAERERLTNLELSKLEEKFKSKLSPEGQLNNPSGRELLAAGLQFEENFKELASQFNRSLERTKISGLVLNVSRISDQDEQAVVARLNSLKEKIDKSMGAFSAAPERASLSNGSGSTSTSSSHTFGPTYSAFDFEARLYKVQKFLAYLDSKGRSGAGLEGIKGYAENVLDISSSDPLFQNATDLNGVLVNVRAEESLILNKIGGSPVDQQFMQNRINQAKLIWEENFKADGFDLIPYDRNSEKSRFRNIINAELGENTRAIQELMKNFDALADPLLDKLQKDIDLKAVKSLPKAVSKTEGESPIQQVTPERRLLMLGDEGYSNAAQTLENYLRENKARYLDFEQRKRIALNDSLKMLENDLRFNRYDSYFRDGEKDRILENIYGFLELSEIEPGDVDREVLLKAFFSRAAVLSASLQEVGGEEDAFRNLGRVILASYLDPLNRFLTTAAIEAGIDPEFLDGVYDINQAISRNRWAQNQQVLQAVHGPNEVALVQADDESTKSMSGSNIIVFRTNQLGLITGDAEPAVALGSTVDQTVNPVGPAESLTVSPSDSDIVFSPESLELIQNDMEPDGALGSVADQVVDSGFNRMSVNPDDSHIGDVFSGDNLNVPDWVGGDSGDSDFFPNQLISPSDSAIVPVSSDFVTDPDSGSVEIAAWSPQPSEAQPASSAEPLATIDFNFEDPSSPYYLDVEKASLGMVDYGKSQMIEISDNFHRELAYSSLEIREKRRLATSFSERFFIAIDYFYKGSLRRAVEEAVRTDLFFDPKTDAGREVLINSGYYEYARSIGRADESSKLLVDIYNEVSSSLATRVLDEAGNGLEAIGNNTTDLIELQKKCIRAFDMYFRFYEDVHADRKTEGREVLRKYRNLLTDIQSKINNLQKEARKVRERQEQAEAQKEIAMILNNSFKSALDAGDWAKFNDALTAYEASLTTSPESQTRQRIEADLKVREAVRDLYIAKAAHPLDRQKISDLAAKVREAINLSNELHKAHDKAAPKYSNILEKLDKIDAELALMLEAERPRPVEVAIPTPVVENPKVAQPSQAAQTEITPDKASNTLNESFKKGKRGEGWDDFDRALEVYNSLLEAKKSRLESKKYQALCAYRDKMIDIRKRDQGQKKSPAVVVSESDEDAIGSLDELNNRLKTTLDRAKENFTGNEERFEEEIQNLNKILDTAKSQGIGRNIEALQGDLRAYKSFKSLRDRVMKLGNKISNSEAAELRTSIRETLQLIKGQIRKDQNRPYGFKRWSEILQSLDDELGSETKKMPSASSAKLTDDEAINRFRVFKNEIDGYLGYGSRKIKEARDALSNLEELARIYGNVKLLNIPDYQKTIGTETNLLRARVDLLEKRTVSYSSAARLAKNFRLGTLPSPFEAEARLAPHSQVLAARLALASHAVSVVMPFSGVSFGEAGANLVNGYGSVGVRSHRDNNSLLRIYVNGRELPRNLKELATRGQARRRGASLRVAPQTALESTFNFLSSADLNSLAHAYGALIKSGFVSKVTMNVVIPVPDGQLANAEALKNYISATLNKINGAGSVSVVLSNMQVYNQDGTLNLLDRYSMNQMIAGARIAVVSASNQIVLNSIQGKPVIFMPARFPKRASGDVLRLPNPAALLVMNWLSTLNPKNRQELVALAQNDNVRTLFRMGIGHDVNVPKAIQFMTNVDPNQLGFYQGIEFSLVRIKVSEILTAAARMAAAVSSAA